MKNKKNEEDKKKDGNFFQEFYKRFPGMKVILLI